MAHFLAYWKTYAQHEPIAQYACKRGYGSKRLRSAEVGDTVWTIGVNESGAWCLLQRLVVARVRKPAAPVAPRIFADSERSGFFDSEYSGGFEKVLKELEFARGNVVKGTGTSIGMSVQSIRQLSALGAEKLAYYAAALGDGSALPESKTPFSDPEAVRRRELLSSQIVRNSAHAQKIKALYKGHCQLCGEAIRLPDGRIYSEAHHIQALGGIEPGPDNPENMLCVCPNCHVKLDYAIIPLDKVELKRGSKHRINQKYLDYHNARYHRLQRTTA